MAVTSQCQTETRTETSARSRCCVTQMKVREVRDDGGSKRGRREEKNKESDVRDVFWWLKKEQNSKRMYETRKERKKERRGREVSVNSVLREWVEPDGKHMLRNTHVFQWARVESDDDLLTPDGGMTLISFPPLFCQSLLKLSWCHLRFSVPTVTLSPKCFLVECNVISQECCIQVTWEMS